MCEPFSNTTSDCMLPYRPPIPVGQGLRVCVCASGAVSTASRCTSVCACTATRSGFQCCSSCPLFQNSSAIRFMAFAILPHLLREVSILSLSLNFMYVMGLRLVLQSYPRRKPYMRFLYVRPEVCPRVSMFPESGFLQIPPHDGHPCLRLYPSHHRADSGLSPVRNVRRRAHQKSANGLTLPFADLY